MWESVCLCVCVCVCVCICLEGQPRKRGIDSVNDCLIKNVLNVGQSRRIVYDRNEWWGLVSWNEPLTLTRCYSCSFTMSASRFSV